jgi:hypothetical protein
MILRIKNSFDKQINGTGLYLFRIFFSCILFAEVCQIKYYRHLIFDQMPFVNPSDLDFGIIFSFWQIIVLALILGLSTRFVTIVNFVFTTFFFMTLSEFEYHVFYTYQAISLLFLFLPVSRSVSLDNLLEKIKHSNQKELYVPSIKVNVWCYYLPILLGIAFVYIDSFFYKINCPKMWLTGLGVWFPSTLPMATHVNLNWLLNQEYLMKFLGYLTIVFEGIFLFTFWFKKWRIPFVIIGVGLHFGILIVFPIPWFALTAISIYILLVPISWWGKGIKNRKEKLRVYVNENCKRCLQTKIIIGHFVPKTTIGFYLLQDINDKESLMSASSKKHHVHVVRNGMIVTGIEAYRIICLNTWYLLPIGLLLGFPGVNRVYDYVFSKLAIHCKKKIKESASRMPSAKSTPNVIDDIKIFKKLNIGQLKIMSLKLFVFVIFFFQLLTTLVNPKLQKQIKTLPSSTVQIFNNQIYNLQKKCYPISSNIMGFAKHDVFVEAHFNNYDTYFNIREKGGDFLRVYDEFGMPSFDNYGTNWRFFTFEVNSPNTHVKKASAGFKRYLHFNRGKHKIEKDVTYELLKKNINVSWEWKKDQLQDAINEPWQIVGEIGWKNGDYFVDIFNAY